MSDLPDLGEILTGLLADVPRDQQPLLIAAAERMAAQRYRGWAADPAYEAHRDGLLGCALREEEIASRIEALYEDLPAAQQGVTDSIPTLQETARDLFEPRPLREQLLLQASGERLGAATWRAFAVNADAASAAVFAECAVLEEESAAVLDGILDATA